MTLTDSATLATNTEANLTIYLHIPKTAGTTLNQVIRKQYAATTIIDGYGHAVDSQAYIGSLPQSQKNSAVLIKGHLPFGVHELMGRRAVYFTILRDPVERLLSMYYYLLRSPNHYLHRRVVSGDLSLEDILTSKLSSEFDNAQVRQLSGIWFDRGFGECTAEMLSLAKDNILKHFAVVGLTERFDETLLLLRRAFAWRSVFYVSRNVTPNRPTLDKIDRQTLDRLRNLNWLDDQLYHWVSERFELQIAEMDGAIQRELSLFRLCNSIFGTATGAYQPLKHWVRASISSMARVGS